MMTIIQAPATACLGMTNDQINHYMKRLSLLAVLAMAACTALVPEDPANENESSTNLVDIESVSMTAHNFEFEDGITKTSITVDDEQGAVFAWASDDIVGVFPNIEDATQVKFPIADGDVQGGTSTSEANFTGNGWAVMKANKYMAYYPFTADMNLDKKAVPVDFSGQKQTGSGSTAHLNRYDHMAAAATSPSSNGNIGLDFQHMGALLQLNMAVPKIAEYTSLTLSCDDAEFVIDGTIDLTAATPAISGGNYSHEFTVELENITTTTVNQNISVYVMIPPVDMSGKTIGVRLRGPHADFSTSFTRGDNKPFKAGKAYRPSLGTLEGGDVILLEQGTDFNVAIKSLANGEEYILDKTDYLIKHIVFKANDGSVPTLPYVDVSDSGSAQPVYAAWDSSTGTITVSSASPKVYANSNPSHMFIHLQKLESINFCDFSTVYATNTSRMFLDCKSLSSLDLSTLDFTNVGNVGLGASCSAAFMFQDCSNLESIQWPTTKKFSKEDNIYQDLGCMFKGCSKLASIDLSCFEGCRISSIGETFSGCSLLANVDFSDLDMSSCGGYTGAFSNCSSLTSIDASNFGWSNIDGECIWVFSNCSSLKTLNLGDFSIPNGGRLDSIFEGCSSLEELNYTTFAPSGTSLTGLFSGCSKMTSLPVANLVTSKTTVINGMYNNCSSLTSLDLSTWNTTNVTNYGGLFAGCSALTTIDLSAFKTYEATSIHGMFSGCSNLSSIIWGSNFNTEKVTDMSELFNGCSSLESLDLSCFSTSKVISFWYMFYGCSSLSSINFGSNFDTHYAENFGAMFQGCSSLTSLDLSFFNTSSATSYENMFASCDNLGSLDISSFTSDHVSGIFQMFTYCSRLTELKLGTSFAPTQFSYTFGDVAKDVTSCTIYCSETFMNNLYAYEHSPWCFDLSKIIWKNASTGETMTYPNS